MAGTNLHKLLLTKGCIPQTGPINMQLAVGESKPVTAELFIRDIEVKHRTISTTLIAITENQKGKTLLVVDFVKSANIIMGFSNNELYFGGEPNNRPRFPTEEPVTVEFTNYVLNKTISIWKQEGERLDNNQRRQMNLRLTELTEIFSLSSHATPFPKHTIGVTDDIPMAVQPYRMSPKKNLLMLRPSFSFEENVGNIIYV